MQKKIVPVILAAALLFSGLFSVLTIHGLQGNARIINYAGVVRGATQRLIKQELNQQPDDALILKLDGILSELSTGEGKNQLGRLNDDAFQSLIDQMRTQWDDIKNEILLVRNGQDTARLYKMSETYFELADKTVSAAEIYSERQIIRAEYALLFVSALFLLIAAFLTRYGIVQEKRQRAIKEAENMNRRRSQDLELMSKALHATMDEISELMYISDPNDYELIYMNKPGRKSFGVEKLCGQKCYKVIQKRDTPCEFCTTKYLSFHENHTWEHTNPVTGKHYLLKDRLIQWEGRTARLETAFDISDTEAEKQLLKYALDAEQMIMECVRDLYQEHDLETSILFMLERLGRFLSADRSYIGIVRDNKWYNDYEWCKDGIIPQKDILQALPLSAIASWLPVFKRQECVLLEDIETLRESHPDEYELLHSQDIVSLVAAPLEENGNLWGFLGVDNPPPERIRSIASLLQTLCYFLMLAYRHTENQQQLSHLSYFDTLTSFYNRNRYMEDSAALHNYKGSIGVVYIDVNGLKDANDRYGHAYGDKLLLNCTKQIRETFGHAGFYRIGGDEFVVFCQGITEDAFWERVNMLRTRFGPDGTCHAAIGAKWTAELTDIQKLIATADARMYEDKKAFYRNNPVTNRYRHHSDEILFLSDPDVLKEEIRKEHFVVYLQPKISSDSRTVVGAEALIRYQPRLGTLVMPDNFLPLLDANHSTNQIDFYVFEYACSQISEWKKKKKQISPVSVNFSRNSLIQPNFVKRLNEICEKYGTDKKNIEIELTETAQKQDGLDLKSLIHDLRQEGFLIAIDDFGTENVGLSLLSMMEFDVLKLDKSMITDLCKNENAVTVINSIVTICDKLDVKLVAEGIETEEQLEILRKCGVKLAQGFLFSKPVPIEEYENKYL